MAPIDRKLVDVTLLDDEQLAWLNNYHKEVYCFVLLKVFKIKS